jgi:hypothetical protein
MQIKLAAGAEVDIASSGEVNDAAGSILDWLNEDRKAARPNYLPLANTSTGADGIVSLGSPPTGRIWNVLGISICGQNDSVQSSAGTVAFYIGNAPSVGVPMLSQLRYPRMSLPFSIMFGTDVLWCDPQNEIFFNLAALAGVTQFVGSAWVAEYREDDILMRTGR